MQEVQLGGAPADTGIGIAADKLNTIFESFQQARTDTARKYGGTGLGTTIVKRLVELQGGTLDLISTLGKGTSVTVQLALPISSVALAELQSTAIGGDAFEPGPLLGHVLLADDNKINQRLAQEVLTSFGLTADFADNGKQVIELVQQKEYDLILMDTQMPEMDGIEATQHIRTKLPAHAKSTPILAMSAHSLKAQVERCKSCLQA